MSKSKGNVVAPLEYVEQYGADALRTLILFLGPPDQDAEWQDNGIEGTRRFLDRFWRFGTAVAARGDAGIVDAPAPGSIDDDVARELVVKAHDTIRRVSNDIDPRFQFNTALAALMELTNAATKSLNTVRDDAGSTQALRWTAQTLASLLQPFAPHLACEVWESLGGEALWAVPWPEHDDAWLRRDTVSIAVQVNGKLRGQVEIPADADQSAAIAAARADDKVAAHVEGLDTVKEIYVPGRLVNIVVRG
jgi:leucyl-tRNA synthetase